MPLVPYVARFSWCVTNGRFFCGNEDTGKKPQAFFPEIGGCSSKVERLPVEQDGAGALPVSHPKGYI